MDLFIIVLPAVLCTLFFKFYWKTDITNKEALITLGVNVGISLLLVGALTGYKYSLVYDTELYSGKVVSKEKDQVSCEHSYSCNCRQTCSGSGSSRRCSRTCDTCYDHAFDYDWDVHTTLGRITIDRIDRQGVDEPPRFTQTRIGEPVAAERSYKNYLLADPKTLFVELPALQNTKFILPGYPETYDYWRVNRAVGDLPKTLREEFNDYLANTLITLGPKKQLNVVVAVTKQPELYFSSLMAAWRGGKKNDVILVYGVDSDLTIQWFKANSYAMGMGNKELLIRLENSALGNTLNLAQLQTQIQVIDKHFKRLSASEFSFKLQGVQTPLWVVCLLMVLNLAGSIGVSVYMKRNEL